MPRRAILQRAALPLWNAQRSRRVCRRLSGINSSKHTLGDVYCNTRRRIHLRERRSSFTPACPRPKTHLRKAAESSNVRSEHRREACVYLGVSVRSRVVHEFSEFGEGGTDWNMNDYEYRYRYSMGTNLSAAWRQSAFRYR